MVFMRTRVGRRHPGDEQGAVAVLTAILMVVLMISAAIVVDLGNARDVRRQSQNAADAASLAGAGMLYPASGVCPLGGVKPCLADAVAKVRLSAMSNFQVSDSEWGLCTATLPTGFVSSPLTSCISYDSATSPATTVRVIVPTRKINTFFGGVVGSSSIDVSSTASATLLSGTSCTLCILGDFNTNTGDLAVLDGGSIAVNGDVNANGSAGSSMTATWNGVHGTVNGNTTINPTQILIPGFSAPPSPLPLDVAGLDATPKTAPCTQGPGFYAGDVAIPNNATCTLQAGLYVISGTWSMSNNSVLSGTGVTLYVKTSGALDFKNGRVSGLTPPAVGQTGAGYAIIYDPSNTNLGNCAAGVQAPCLNLQGNGVTSITGVIYAPGMNLAINGGSQFGFIGGPIIVNDVNTVGNGSGVRVTNAAPATMASILLHLNQ